MIRLAELAAIKSGDIDLAFRRWERPRVVVGTRMRTSVGVVEVTSVERVAASKLTAADAKRAGAASLAALRRSLAAHPERSVYRVGLRYGGDDPRVALRQAEPTGDEVTKIRAALERLDRASAIGPWTAATLRMIDDSPATRAPDLAASVGRDTASFKRDVRKLKEMGLTESLDIGYRLSRRGAVVVDADRAEQGLPPRDRPAPAPGTPLGRIGAPATRALAAQGITTLEQVADRSESELLALHGVGPFAIERLRNGLADLGLGLRPMK
jgi:hypothetical protein